MNGDKEGTGLFNQVSSSVENTMQNLNCKVEDPFYVLDVQDILKKHKNWLLKLPRVRPFYAVKCNPCPLVLELLAALGTGFDCASKSEIDSVLDMKVAPSNIIYANPCKTKSYIKHAAVVGVDLMTFDNEYELYKIVKLYPQSRLVLRIKVDDSHAVCRFSSKFGADLSQVAYLLSIAKHLNLNVVGVSFHVGSGCENTKSYADAIANARYVFDIAREMGFNFNLLDLGGGFPGTNNVAISFDEIAMVINEALEHHFPENFQEDLSIIAEPGRYYVASAFTLNTMIIAKKVVNSDTNMNNVMYYLNDGVYGSFNCIIFDHWIVEPIPLLENMNRELMLSTLWGPTCDSMDCIKKDVILPEMNIGEWILFRDMGAYTMAAASNFNGFVAPVVKCQVSAYTLENVKSLQKWPRAKMINFDDGHMDVKSILGNHFFNLIHVH